MDLNIGKEVAAMKRMTVNELRARYAEVFGEETNGRHKEWLIRRIAWRIQAQAEGDISERPATGRRIGPQHRHSNDGPEGAEPAPAETGQRKTATPHLSPDRRLPVAGQEIAREYKGQTLIVRVLPHGFEFDGEVYKSLSAVAKAITGQHCNGYHFFRLGGQGGQK